MLRTSLVPSSRHDLHIILLSDLCKEIAIHVLNLQVLFYSITFAKKKEMEKPVSELNIFFFKYRQSYFFKIILMYMEFCSYQK